MARDPLAVLSRVREAAVTEASRELAAALAAAAGARCRLEAHRQHVRQEQTDAVGEGVAAFAAWLPTARRRTEQMVSDLHLRDGVVLRLQHVLVLRKTDAEAVAKAMQRKRQEADLVRARKEQAVMDEVGGRRRTLTG